MFLIATIVKKSFMSKPVVIVIPAYNEELAIGSTIEDYIKHFPEASLVVVDNNSSDNSAAIIKKLLRPEKDFYLFEAQQGKGFAIKRGLSRLDAEVFIMTDGDLTYRAEDAKRLYELMHENRMDMVVGDRLASGGYKKQNERSGHTFGNWFLSKAISMFAGRPYNDVLSGLRIMSKPFVGMLNIESKGFSLETELNIAAAYLKAEVVEEPIDYAARPDGSDSKLNTLVDGSKILYFAFINWIAFAPMQFFTALSAVSLLGSSFIGLVLLDLYVKEGAVTATATAVLAASLGIVGLASFFIGLMLTILLSASRRQTISMFSRSKRRWNMRLDQKQSKT